MQTTFEVPQGSFELSRTDIAEDSLRAWDAADEYILHQLSESDIAVDGRVLLVNDGFGALAVALAAQASDIVSWSDSFVAHSALDQNMAANELPQGQVTKLRSSDEPEGTFDLVLIKIPKHNSLLEDQLYRIKPLLSQNSVVIAGGMVRHIHTSTLDLFAKILGPTKTSLARKKARLAFVNVDESLASGTSPWPTSWKHAGVETINQAGVFSARKIDIGTRFFLEHLPTLDPGNATGSAVDLGCGNGIVGATFLKQNPEATCTFVDESYGAIASATATVMKLGSDFLSQGRFLVGDGLDSGSAESIDYASVDLVLNNPPFHTNSALSSSISDAMFRSSRRVLRPGGGLVVVGNRHLGYHVRLKNLFGNCEVVASNAKFVVLRAIRHHI